MEMSLGEIAATLKLRDQLTPQLTLAQQEIGKFAQNIGQIEQQVAKLKPLPDLVTPDQQEKLARFERMMASVGEKTGGATSAGAEFVGGFVKSLATGAVLGAVGTLSGMAWSAGELATNLSRAEQASGIAATKLDELSRKGAPAGVALADIQKAALDLEKKIAKGDDSVVGALGRLGVSIQDVPRGEAFLQVMDRIARIEDPAKQAKAAIETLGNVDLLPLIQKMRDAEGAAASMTGAQIRGLADAKQAIATWRDNAVRDVGSVLGSFSSVEGLLDGILQRLGMWGQNILGAKEFFDTLPGKLEAASKAAGAGFAEGAPKGTAAFRAPDLSLPGADTFKSQMKAINDETERAIRLWEDYNKKINAAGDILSGRDLPGKVNELADALANADRKGGPTNFQFDLLARNARELRDQGAKLPPVLADMALGLDILEFNTRTAAMKTPLLTSELDRLTRVAFDSNPAIYQFNQDIDRMVAIAAKGFGPESLRAVQEFGVKVGTLPGPPVGPWDEWKERAKGTLESVERNVSEHIVAIIGRASHWKKEFLGIWGEIKSGIQSVLSDLLYEFEHRFIAGLLSSITGAQGGFAGAFAGLFGMGGPAAGAAASGAAGATAGGGGMFASWGAMSGATWAAAFGVAALGVAAGWGIWKMIRGEPSPERQTGISHEEYELRYGKPGAGYDPIVIPDPPSGADYTGLVNGVDIFANPFSKEYQDAIAKLKPMGSGGIVTSPTAALIGEAGPEAVIPLPPPSTTPRWAATLTEELRGLREDLAQDESAERLEQTIRTLLPLAIRDALVTAR